MKVELKNCSKKMLLGVALIGSLAMRTGAWAAEESKTEGAATSAAPSTAPAASTTSEVPLAIGNVTLASDYAYRGISQTRRKPAIQGGLDADVGYGIYVGTWGSNISWLSDAKVAETSSLEWDFYGGYRYSLPDSVKIPLAIDVGGLYYYYPGRYPTGITNPDTFEVYLALSSGPVALKYSLATTNLFGAVESKNSGYWDLSLSQTWWGVTFAAHGGYQQIKNGTSYKDGKLSVGYSWKGLDFALAYVDTTLKYRKNGEVIDADRLNQGRAILTVGRKF